jgi:quercetin dioxygenase-like cupin family protein
MGSMEKRCIRKTIDVDPHSAFYLQLIRMTMKPGDEDEPHDHPIHHMWVVKGGKLQIKHEGWVDVKDIPSGIAMIMPAGPHQVQSSWLFFKCNLLYMFLKLQIIFSINPMIPQRCPC